MYKALTEIGKYKKGDKVPDEQALVWLKMYLVPQVEKCESDPESEEEKKDVPPADAPPGGKDNPMLDDYLARNSGVVKSNILEDNLDKDSLEKLHKLELADRNREKVLKAIKHKLGELND